MSVIKAFVPYVQSASSRDVPPPYHFPGVTVNAFAWEMEMDPVQKYCDRYLNLGSRADRGFQYAPAATWPYAMLLFLDYPSMISSNPNPEDTGEVPYADRGITSQTEAFVALPVIRYGNPPNQFTHSALEWILPVIGVSEPWSCVCGREMLGLGKLLANIELGESTFPDSFKGSIGLPGWMGSIPGEIQRIHPFVEVNTGPVLPTFRTGSPPQSSMATLFDSREAELLIESFARLGNIVDRTTLGMIPTTMRTLGLKQFRDALYPEKALYQALVTCRSYYSRIRDLQLYDERDVTIAFHDTGSFHDILSVLLDLEPKASGEMQTAQPTAAFRFVTDIDYDRMRVIHEFPIDGGDGIAAREARSDLASPWFRPWQGFFRKPPLS